MLEVLEDSISRVPLALEKQHIISVDIHTLREMLAAFIGSQGMLAVQGDHLIGSYFWEKISLPSTMCKATWQSLGDCWWFAVNRERATHDMLFDSSPPDYVWTGSKRVAG